MYVCMYVLSTRGEWVHVSWVCVWLCTHMGVRVYSIRRYSSLLGSSLVYAVLVSWVLLCYILFYCPVFYSAVFCSILVYSIRTRPFTFALLHFSTPGSPRITLLQLKGSFPKPTPMCAPSVHHPSTHTVHLSGNPPP